MGNRQLLNKPDYVVRLEDGKKLKMLKRHLMMRYQPTPEQYRQRWNLPLTTRWLPHYAATRRELAKSIGLGRKPGTKVRAKAASKGRAVSKPVA